MPNVIYSSPAVLLARDNVLNSYCATVNTSGQPIGINDELSLQPVDPNGGIAGQLFVYGSDQRINDQSGKGSVGDPVAIFTGSSGNGAFSWALAICPPPFPS